MNRRCALTAGLVLLVFCRPGAVASGPNHDARADVLALAKKARDSLAAGKPADAIEPLENALSLARTVFGPEHPDTATLMQNLGGAYLELKRYDKAGPLLEDSVRIAKAKRPKDDPELATCLETLGRLHCEQGRWAKAGADYRQALEVREAKVGKDHANLAELLGVLTRVCETLDEHEQAESFAVRWLGIAEKAHGKSHIEVAPPLDRLAVIYRDSGRFAEAESRLRRSLEIREGQRVRDEDAITRTRMGLAVLYRTAGRPDRAEPILKACREQLESRLGEGHPNLAEVVREQAFTAFELGKYADAEDRYRHALRLFEKPGADPLELAHTLNLQWGMYYRLGRYTQAEAAIKRAVTVKQKLLGPDHPEIADLLQQLASVYKRIGRHQDAKQLYVQSLNLTERRLGDDHPNVATCLYNLAMLYSENRLFNDAEPLFQECLRIQEHRFGKDHLAVAHTLVGWAGQLMQTGPYDEAEKLLDRALAIRKGKLDPDHYDLTHTLGEMAELYIRQGRLKEADDRLRQCLGAQQKQLGKDHPAVVTTLERLADVAIRRKEWQAAGDLIDRSRRAHRSYLGQVLAGLSEREQLGFLDTTGAWRYMVALSFGLRQAADARVAAQSAAWVLNGKGVAQQTAGERALLARDSTDPKLAGLVTELQATRSRLAVLTVAGPGPKNGDAVRLERDTLVRNEQDLVKQIGLSGGSTRPDLWAEVDSVRAAIPKEGVLIEFARFEVRVLGGADRKRLWEPARYAAWVIPPAGKGRVAVVDLGEADAIEAAVKELRRSLARPPRPTRGPAVIRGGLEYLGREADTHKALADLAGLVLDPLRPHLENARRWLLSPDADLWLVPWAALPLPWTTDREYAVEGHTISYLVSGRDLLIPASRVRPGPPLVLADPDYDFGTGAVRRPERHTPVGPDGWLDLPLVGRLEGTAAEADAVRGPLGRYAGAEPRLFRREHAVEGALKSARSPRIVLLSTHGFFRPQPKPDPAVFGIEPVGPLLQCGLVLAGANRERDPNNPGADDGVLTGLEILAVELRGTELVVLSACETGLGDVRSAEGVAGLRQAFQLAGARDVLATLWQVPDGDTAVIMARFFEKLAQGKAEPAEALRDAQREQLRERQTHGQTTHPFYWAAFTLTGPGPPKK